MPFRLLVVEDDPDLREVLSAALEQEGFDVSRAENGVEALVQLYFGTPPHVVILNLHMPVMSGMEVIEVVRLDPALAALPIVVVTGAPVPPQVMRLANAVLSKPFDLDVLYAAVHDVLPGSGPPSATPAPLAP